MANIKGAFHLEVGDKFTRTGIIWQVVSIYDFSSSRRQYTIKRTDLEFSTTMVVDAYQPCKPFKMA